MCAVLALSLGLALLSPAWAGAEGTLSSAAFEAWIDTSERSFGQGAEEPFHAACDALPAQVTRLQEPLSPAQAGRLHAFMALCSYSSQVNRADSTLQELQDAVTPYVRAARNADPRAGLGVGARQDGSSPLTRWFAAPSREPAAGPLLADVGWGRVLVDGREARSFPSDTPSVVQRSCGVGPFGPSRYLQVGAPPPDWERCPMKPGTARHVGLALGTGAAALLAMGMEVGAVSTYARYTSTDTPPGELDALWRQNKLFNYGLWGAGALTAGLGATLVITW